VEPRSNLTVDVVSSHDQLKRNLENVIKKVKKIYETIEWQNDNLKTFAATAIWSSDSISARVRLAEPETSKAISTVSTGAGSLKNFTQNEWRNYKHFFSDWLELNLHKLVWLNHDAVSSDNNPTW
jgi:hypothetical protein